MPKYFAIMFNYAQVGYGSYYAQNYAGKMCQGLQTTLGLTNYALLMGGSKGGGGSGVATPPNVKSHSMICSCH